MKEDITQQVLSSHDVITFLHTVLPVAGVRSPESFWHTETLFASLCILPQISTVCFVGLFFFVVGMALYFWLKYYLIEVLVIFYVG